MRSSARRSVAASTWLRAEMPNTMWSQRQTPRSSIAASETFVPAGPHVRQQIQAGLPRVAAALHKAQRPRAERRPPGTGVQGPARQRRQVPAQQGPHRRRVKAVEDAPSERRRTRRGASTLSMAVRSTEGRDPQRQRGGPADETGQAGGCEAAGRLPGASEAQDPRLACENDFFRHAQASAFARKLDRTRFGAKKTLITLKLEFIFGTCWRCYVYSVQASIPYSTYSTYSMELGGSGGSAGCLVRPI